MNNFHPYQSIIYLSNKYCASLIYICMYISICYIYIYIYICVYVCIYIYIYIYVSIYVYIYLCVHTQTDTHTHTHTHTHTQTHTHTHIYLTINTDLSFLYIYIRMTNQYLWSKENCLESVWIRFFVLFCVWFTFLPLKPQSKWNTLFLGGWNGCKCWSVCVC